MINYTAIIITAIICVTVYAISWNNGRQQRKEEKRQQEARQIEIPSFMQQRRVPEDQAKALRAAVREGAEK